MLVRIIIEGIGLSMFLFIVCAVGIKNGAVGMVHLFAILSILNLFDRLVMDGYWVGRTKAWTIPGTEEYKPYINQKDKAAKWAMGTAGFAVLSAAVAAVMALAGDMLLGYGAAKTEVSGIPVTFARYLTVSDGRIFWSAILGMTGIPLECLCYFAIYRLIAYKSEKYAHTYRTGIFGCLIFGGCGVHVPCCAVV